MNHLTPDEQAMRARCDAATGSCQRIHEIIDEQDDLDDPEIYRPTIRAHATVAADSVRDLPACLDTIEKLRAELAEAVVLVERIGKCLGEPCYAFYGEIRDFLAKHKERNDGNK